MAGITSRRRGRTLSEIRESYFHSRYGKIMTYKKTVAPIIIGVTFMAVFTVPGGYFEDGSDQGLAILSKKPAFKAFIVFDTLAFILSLMTFIMTYVEVKFPSIYFAWIMVANYLEAFSFISMILAFETGVYVVVAPLSPSLANSILVLSCLFTCPTIIFPINRIHKRFNHQQFLQQFARKLKMEGMQHAICKTQAQ
jgi:hypothetical protein